MIICSMKTSSAIKRHIPAEPQHVTGDTAVHDPTMCKDSSGVYYVFSTARGLEIRTSKDRIDWKLIGKVWPNGAPWTDKYTNTSNGVLWAPDCTYVDGQFILYYSASTSGSQNSGIFLAKSNTGQPGSSFAFKMGTDSHLPTGAFSNEGLITSTSSSNNYNAIDPNLLIDNDNWFLSLGSFWTGIKSMTLNRGTGKPVNSTITPLAQRTTNNGAVEGSAMFKYGNYYYLFTSWDKCCQGVNSTYNIRVGRSNSPTDGFVDKSGVALTSGGGSPVLEGHGNIHGPGGQDLMMDGDVPIIIYHYYTSAGNNLGINRLDFSSGWPVVV
ncbi:arabinanase [Panaeolus papilionaceus]|nr:arabinanase [Panaeolus papilionaceus]